MASACFSVAKANIARVGTRAQGSRVVARAERNLWLPGSDAPAWLDGTYPGDYGFDPLGLASDPKIFEYFRHAEVYHCRWAMLGAAGIAIPSILTKAGLLNVPEWYVAGKVSQDQSGIPFWALVAVEFLLFGWVEHKRLFDIRNPGSQGDGSFFGITDGLKGVEPGYPGGIFDPMGMSKDPKNFARMKQSEIINGRLAMTALVGFVAQYNATGKGPADNLFDHIANPGMVNFATNGVSFPHPVLN